MKTISVIDVVSGHPQIKAGQISFVRLHENNNRYRNRFLHTHYAVSFVLSGQKHIIGSMGNTTVTTGQGLVIPQGNSIMSEYGLNDEGYSRLIVLFSAGILVEFLKKYNVPIQAGHYRARDLAFLHFTNTAYLTEYVNNVSALIYAGKEISYPLALHKLEELLLALYELHPEQLINLVKCQPDNRTLSLKGLIEKNLLSNLTLEELAFLSNRSLSSFKRDFEKVYGITPQRYIRKRKLEVASIELSRGKHPGELYDSFGYGTLSNFNTAFKKQFGITPAAYSKIH